MTEAADLEATDLDEYRDPPAPLEASDIMAAAQLAAMLPKPTIRDMIEEVSNARWAIEDGQSRLLAIGLRTEPYPPYMRRAGVLAATVNFLDLINANQDAVKRALKVK